ncbi:lipopolysaccharide biosynthesis protein [Vibrio panuliri]|uniref:Lipopolysaccharide biosynthesis protein n=1 Tax=Vibrio panuliri TaxID=1381081 RepID=A0A1Q9HMU6_9VIBR|nr:lipopolysaccharide biosynthesis protein [Vibrio panuliri]OLQ92079.1 lipopolysaccharide biosynthesis protein [Vibrio panuliri]
MTTQTVEQRFQALRLTLKPIEFNSIEFLVAKAQQIEAQDPELAKRILVRVTNLKKQVASDKLKGSADTEEKEQKKGESNKAKVESQKKEEQKPNNQLSELQSTFNFPLLTFFTRKPFIALVIIPTLIFAFYQNFWASERFVSRAQVIVQQPDGMATMDTSMALLSGLGVPSSGIVDTELVKAYILSNDMLVYLDETISLREHYSHSSIDYFSRSDETDSWEDFFDYYLTRLDVYIDSNSNIVHVNSQAFDSEFAHQLTQAIVQRAEWYINSIGHQLANAQLEFVQQEHLNIEQRLQQSQTELLNFQQRYNLLDPLAEGLAMQQITYGLEGQISAKEAELKGLLGIMNARAPQVISAKNQLAALKQQLEKERTKLSDSQESVIPVSEILAKYTDLKVKMEFALQAYTSSQISLEKSRIEAYRQLKYLIVVESATKPNESKYPDVFYNISLFGFVLSMIFVVVRIISLTIHELR